MTTAVATCTDTFVALPENATRPQLALYLQVSIATLARWAMEDKGPKATILGGRAVRYRRADVLAWLDSQTEAS